MVAYFGKNTSNGYGSTFIRVARFDSTTTTGSNAEYTDIEQNSGGSTPFRYGTYGDTNIINGGAATNGVYGSINFVTSGSTRMTIAGGTSAGNVGIGTTNPGYKLDVNGTFRTATNNLTIFNDYLYVSPTQNNTLNSAYFTNGIADMWINYAGYNNGNTQFRNFNVGDGKNGIVAWFDGTNKRVSINNSQTANYTLEVNGIIGLYGASNNHRRLAQPSVWGYSSSYRTIILGSTSTTYNVADGAVTLCFGVDISANANGSFQGDGRELVFRNLTRFVTPDNTNTSYLNPLSFNNGSVGIGTDSPAAKFEMFGGEMAIKLSANTTSSFQWKNSSGTKIQEIRYDDSDGSMTLGGVGGYPIKFITSNTEKVRISGTGNLGIGTTNPATLLHVDTAGSDARIRVSAGTNTVQGGMIANTGTSLVYAGSVTNHGFSIRTNDTDRVRIQTDGNVGIGITSPTVKLTVSADVTDADVGQLRLVGSTSSAKMLSLGYQTTSNYGFISALIAGTGYSNLALQPNGGNVGIGTSNATAKLESYFASNALTINYLATNLDGNSPIPTYGFSVTDGSTETRSIKAGIGYERYLTNGRGALHFYNHSANDTASISGNRSSAGDIKMSLDNNGNVGIGITSPVALLNIRASAPTGTGAVTTGTNVLVDSNTNNYITFRNTGDNGTYAGLVFLDNNVGGYIAYGNAGAAVGSDSMIYGAYQDHIFQNGYVNETLYNRTETMRIKANGNVGIGSTSPGYKLDVVGDINFSSTLKLGGVDVISNSSSDVYINGRVIRNASTSTQDGMYIGYNSGGTTNAHIRFYANAGNERMRIQANDGNVGIGTTSAGKKLDVEGVVRTRGASGTGGFEIGAATTGAAKWRIEWDSASDSLDFNWVG